MCCKLYSLFLVCFFSFVYLVNLLDLGIYLAREWSTQYGGRSWMLCGCRFGLTDGSITKFSCVNS